MSVGVKLFCSGVKSPQPNPRKERKPNLAPFHGYLYNTCGDNNLVLGNF